MLNNDFRSNAVRRLFGLILWLALSGCAVSPATQALLDAYHLNVSDVQTAGGGLNPAFSYLRVQIEGREGFLALGYVDQLADGPVQVWYSGDGDVLRLRDGRVVGVITKYGPDWLGVSFARLPRWDAMGEQAEFERVRDARPGYRYGIREKMLIRRISPPDDTQLQLISASSLSWFEEVVQGASDMPAARYAVGADKQVVYAEQCLTDKYCFSWQNWPSSGKGAH